MKIFLTLMLLASSKCYAESLETHVRRSLQIEPRYAKEIIKTVFEGVSSELEAGREVQVRGFGKFYLSVLEERNMKHPQTKKSYVIPKRAYPRFKSSESLKKKVRKTY